MGEGAKPPKTLADVSHLFFSNVEGRSKAAPPAESGTSDADGDAESSQPAPSTADAASSRPSPSAGGRGVPWRRTGIFAVTGGDDSPGKSTVAVNMAHALMAYGRVALFDADPKLPNARFYLGLPSWNYLSPVTGHGEPAANTQTDAGLVVVDWTVEGLDPAAAVGSGDMVYVDVPMAGRAPIDYAVLDLPVARAGLLLPLADRGPLAVVIARPGRAGFEAAFSALRATATGSDVAMAAIVVNMAPDDQYAAAFGAKIGAAAERLLRMETRLIGAVPVERGIGSAQRETGAIVLSRPDAVTALSLRRVVFNALELVDNGRSSQQRAADSARRESQL